MKSVPEALSLHLAGDHTALAWCARLHRPDGVVHAVTSHDQTITVDGLDYRPHPGLQPGAVDRESPIANGTSSAGWALHYGDLSEIDLLAGRFDSARLRLFLVNWQAPQAGGITIMEGTLGDIRLADGNFESDVLAKAAALNAPVGESISPTCRADLGDQRCRVGLRGLTDELVITHGIDEDDWFGFSGPFQPSGWYAEGMLIWMTGANAGLKARIADHQGQQLRLIEPPTGVINAGDQAWAIAGCDKKIATCRSKFANAINFRGEPFLPGNDALLDYPGLP